MHREDGQATVEWVGLVLLAALVLTGAAALTSGGADRGLGERVAKRITRPAVRPAGAAAGGAAASAAAPRAAAPPLSAATPPTAVAPPPSAPAPPARPPSPGATLRDRALVAFRRLRGVARIGRHAWIVCLGYRRWRHELAHPSAPNEALPLREALAIANDCLNPHGYLFED